MSDEIVITLESLELKKPLDKMTSKELRQLCIDKIPQITGVSGMSKEDIIATIKELFGLKDDDEGEKVSPYKGQISTLKKEIKALRESKVSTEGRKDREIIRRKINKLKKRTRRLAAAV